MIQSLADAELDHRVALAGAHDAYEAVLAKAAADLAAAIRHADARLAVARAREREAEQWRADMRAMLRTYRTDQLEQMLARHQYKLSPVSRVYRSQEDLASSRMWVDILTGELDIRS